MAEDSNDMWWGGVPGDEEEPSPVPEPGDEEGPSLIPEPATNFDEYQRDAESVAAFSETGHPSEPEPMMDRVEAETETEIDAEKVLDHQLECLFDEVGQLNMRGFDIDMTFTDVAPSISVAPSRAKLIVPPLRRYTALDANVRTPRRVDDEVPCEPWRECLRKQCAGLSAAYPSLASWFANPASVPPMPQIGVDVLGFAANDAMSRVVARVNQVFTHNMLCARRGEYARPIFADCVFHVLHSLARETDRAAPKYLAAIEFEFAVAIDLFNATCPAVVPDTVPGTTLRSTQLCPIRAYDVIGGERWGTPGAEFHTYITTNTRSDIRVILKRVEELGLKDNQRVLLVDGTRRGTLTKMLLPFDTVPDLEPHIARHVAEHHQTNTVEGAWRELYPLGNTKSTKVRSIACVSLVNTPQGGNLLLMRSDGSGLRHNTREFTRVSRTFGFRIRMAGLAHQAQVTIIVTEASFPVMADALVRIADIVFAFKSTRPSDALFIARTRASRSKHAHADSDALDALAHAFPSDAPQEHFNV